MIDTLKQVCEKSVLNHLQMDEKMDIEKKMIRVLNRVSQKGFQHFFERCRFHWNKKYVFNKETILKRIPLI